MKNTNIKPCNYWKACNLQLSRKEQVVVTCSNAGVVCLFNFSENVHTLSVSHVIPGNDIEHPIDCIYFTDGIIAVADRTSKDMTSCEVKVIKVEENGTRKSF